MTTKQKASHFLDPVKFQRTFLGRRLWLKQQEIARAVATHPLVSVKGCHASGKTFVAAGFPLHFLCRHQTCKALTTAPTLRQVKTFWDEVATARNGGRVKQLLPEPTTVSLRVNEQRYAMGASSGRGVNVQGFHSDNVLIIADEAPGIEQDIWDALEGIRMGGKVTMLELGNPVVPSGHFFDSFNKNRAIYKTFTISAFDTPNLQHETEARPLTIAELLEMDEERLSFAPYPFLITRRAVKERYLAWGPDHPQYLSRVLAEFPSESPYSIFELAWIERAKREATEQEIRAARRGVIQVGIDVAGPGDDRTSLWARVNGILLRHESWHDRNPVGLVARTLGELAHHPLYRLGAVVIDVTGIGHYFAEWVSGLVNFPVFAFNAGAAPMDGIQFANAKAEAYETCRAWFREGLISDLTDTETEAQLSTLWYGRHPRGLICIESKEDRNKRGIPGSPDDAEALILAFAKIVPASTHVEYRDRASYEISPI